MASVVISPFDENNVNFSINTFALDDWAAWNTGAGSSTSQAPSQRKSGGGSTVGSATTTVAALEYFSAITNTMSWTGGTPTGSGANTNGIYNNVNAEGSQLDGNFSVTLPASTAEREAYIFVSAYGCNCTLTATLSDGSAGPDTDTSMVNGLSGTNLTNGWFKVTYSAGSGSQTLTLKLDGDGVVDYADIEIRAAGWRFTGTSLTPGNGAIALTGYAPTVARTANQGLVPGQAALTIAGYAPTVTQGASVNLIPGAKALVLAGYAPTVVQASASVSLAPGASALTITGHAPTVVNSGVPTWTNENDIGGGQKRREVYWRPLLQRMLDARAEDRPAPPKGRAKVRAKAIEQDAARLVLEGDASVAQFNALLERWTAQHDVEDMPRDPLESFAAAMRFRVEQAGDVERLRGHLEVAKAAKAAKAHKDDEDAALLMLLA